MANDVQAAPDGPRTLAIDIGGTHLKAGVLNPEGVMTAGPERVETPHPSDPEAVVNALEGIIRLLPAFDRVSAGFPGVVRRGHILTAPNLGTPRWHNYALADTLHKRLGKPVRILNDATVQGLGVIQGHGLECVITLGTGFGFALFEDGMPAPHLELSQHPVRKDLTYDEYLGAVALRKIGKKRWNKRLAKVLPILERVFTYDTLCIGGGNAKSVTIALPGNAQIVSNAAGITGGVRLWDARLDSAFPESGAGVTPAAYG